MDSSQQKESTEAVPENDNQAIQELKQLESPQESVAEGVIDADETTTYDHAGQEGSESISNGPEQINASENDEGEYDFYSKLAVEESSQPSGAQLDESELLATENMHVEAISEEGPAQSEFQSQGFRNENENISDVEDTRATENGARQEGSGPLEGEQEQTTEEVGEPVQHETYLDEEVREPESLTHPGQTANPTDLSTEIDIEPSNPSETHGNDDPESAHENEFLQSHGIPPSEEQHDAEAQGHGLFDGPGTGEPNPFDDIENMVQDPELGNDDAWFQHGNASLDEQDDPESRTHSTVENPVVGVPSIFSAETHDEDARDPEAGDAWLHEGNGDLFDDRPDPESQGYTLLEDQEINPQKRPDFLEEPENGTSADVAEAQIGNGYAETDTHPIWHQHEPGEAVAAFSQVQGSLSHGATGLEYVAHQLVDPSESVPKNMEGVPKDEKSGAQQSPTSSSWWENSGNNEEFDFGAVGSERETTDLFGHTNGATDTSNSNGTKKDDPFAEIMGPSESQPPADPFATADPFPSDDLIDDEDFAKLFPTSTQTETTLPTVQVPATTNESTAASTFGETPDPANLFNSSGNFPISTSSDFPLAVSEVEETKSISQVVQPPPTSNPADETGDLIDDLEFIDDSEFIAAFGTISEPTAPPPQQPSVQAVVQPQPATQPRTSRYVPKPAEPQPAQNTPALPRSSYTPLTVTRPASTSISAPAPAPVPTPQTSRTVSSRYAPVYTAQPPVSPPAANKYSQPQAAQTAFHQQQSQQQTWGQRPASAAPHQPERPAAKSSSSSFVTAKGGYSSPYDLPEQLAPKIKRPPPPPIPMHQQPIHDIRPPLSAKPPIMEMRSPMFAGPPPRAASAQPGFTQQSFSPPPPQGPPPQHMGSQRLSSPPPPAGPGYGPPSSKYAAGRMASPPVQQASIQYQEQQPPPNIYARQSVSPPVPHHEPVPPSQRYVSPPMHVTSPTAPVHGHTYQPPVQVGSPPPAAPPPNRYAPGQGPVPQRRVSGQQAPSLAPQPPHSYANVPTYPQQRVASPPYHPPAHEMPHPQQQGLRRPSQTTHQMPISELPEQYGNMPQRQFTGPSDVYHQEPYPQSQLEDPNADLPPHFEMERGDYDQDYSTGAPPVQAPAPYPNRQLQQTPEPIADQQLEINEISPPRPWERGLAAAPPSHSAERLRSTSAYDPPLSALSAAPISPERHRSISPQVTRQPIASPKKDPVAERAMSYPSRKPPSHLKFVVEQSVPLTPEEDFRLKRQGCPVVTFGFGGRIVTMIPRTPHRVNVHGMTPAPVPGAINITSLRGVIEPPALASSFPGPLFVSTKPVKGKAKDIVTWLDKSLTMLEQVRERATSEDEIVQIEDRKVLYKLVKILVENNGALDGSPEIEKQATELLMPQAAKLSASDETQSFGITASSLATSTAAQTTADPTALATYNLTNDFLRSMRDLLMQGDRQGAIRKAVDQKMWGHALLIASSVSPVVWRETAGQFIRYELRETGAKDFDSLRFLYGVLGNEGIESVSELLPPMNRMVSSIQSSASSQGPRFTSWKESLGMVLANKRAVDDPAPIVGLGNALVNDGRVEAGHACFLLSKSASFAAIDMPETQYTLLGGDYTRGKTGLVGLPQILLSEIFEYTQSKFIPEGFMHLLPYKLWHAWALTDYGYTDLSEKYCESIGATLQKEKRGSIFITPLTISVLRDLTERIAEGPHESFTEKSSWFGKKSTKGGDNFWKALETNLTKFVAGDEPLEESPAATSTKKQSEAQDPRFGRIASETSINRMASLPNLRAQATTPVYGSFPLDVGRTPGSHSRYSTVTSESRYTPASRYEHHPTQETYGSEMQNSEYGGLATPEPINRGYSPYATAPPSASFAPAESHHYEPPESESFEEEPVKEEKEPEKPKAEPKKEDEKKDAADKAGGGWFGGWFKRGAAPPEQGTPGKPIKAKLGEESSFYYDKDLKKWVNKKVGVTAAAAPPPPPPPSKKVTKPSPLSAPSPSVTTEAPRPSPIPPVTPTIQTHSPAPASGTPATEPPAQRSSLPPSRSSSTASGPPPPGQKVDPLEALLSSRPVSGARGPRKPARSRYVDVMNK